jgi:hypothetical protein
MVRRNAKKQTGKRTATTAASAAKLHGRKEPPKKSSRKEAVAKKIQPKSSKRNNATTRSTAGPGYKFEDLAAAWLMVKMLRGEAIPGINSPGERLQMQTKALGWEIDDLLVSGRKHNDTEARRLSVSCKSNVQVSSAGLPAAFVAAAWNQWRKPGQMRRGTDGIALITRDTHTAFSATWADIKTWCAGSDIAFTLARINASAKHRRIFSSVRDPGTSAGAPPDDQEVVAFIRALDVFPLAFQLAPSSTEQAAIATCRDIVASGKAEDAEALWKAIVLRAEAARLGDGTISLQELWAELRVSFRLKDHPDFAASIRALTSLGNDYVSRIETGLPNGNRFTRERLSTVIALRWYMATRGRASLRW